MKQSFLDSRFKLTENNTNARIEIMGGITTFMTMAYILAVNPSILSASGMDPAAIFVATALASAVGSILMGLLANYPFALAPGMGLNAFFAFTVVLGMGYSWQFALTAVLVEGIIFIILSLTNVREAIFNAIPSSLKVGVSCGIGLFIALIGCLNAKIVVKNDSTAVSLYDFSANPFKSEGITVVLALIGILITAILLAKKVKGGILFGIIITWLLGIICQLTGLYVPNPELGMYSLLPDFSQGLQLGAIKSTFMQFDFANIASLDFIVVMFSFLFVDLFDTLGTLIGIATQADMLDEEGKLPRIRGALLSDAIATCVGAILGTSTTTTFVESSSGVASGARTGLAAITTGLFFILSLLLSPIFLAIPSFATAPALIVVGFMMLQSVIKFNFDDLTDAIPAYLTLIGMPFLYSISDGICFGVISYTIIKVCTGKAKEVHWLMYILTILFIAKYILI